jgi:hypothetical protein
MFVEETEQLGEALFDTDVLAGAWSVRSLPPPEAFYAKEHESAKSDDRSKADQLRSSSNGYAESIDES